MIRLALIFGAALFGWGAACQIVDAAHLIFEEQATAQQKLAALHLIASASLFRAFVLLALAHLCKEEDE